ncbi:MAG: thioredoxin domain-containing protein [Sphingomonadaceae bacterium]|nr:thioredoxin domain-containing protein [Sphingomonadaceae bacterium]
MRKIFSLSLAGALTLSLAACGSSGGGGAASGEALPKVAAPAGQSWSAVVRATEEGFLMGNPDAPIKVVEYGSLTCSHCGEFSQTSHEELRRDFIDTGRVSFEMRPFIRDPLDLSMAVVAACQGPERFFPLVDSLFAGQNAILENASAVSQSSAAQLQNIQNLPENQRLPAMAQIFGVANIFAARGVSADVVTRCIGDAAAVQRRVEVTSNAVQRYEVNVTPTFMINGEVVSDIATWPQMRDKLRAAGAR